MIITPIQTKGRQKSGVCRYTRRHGPAINFQKGPFMPYVNVRITKDGVTKEKKGQIVKEITATLQNVLGKKPNHIHIVIDLIDEENWGFSGMLTDEYRAQQG